jgi:hypothetical protein
MIQLTSLYSPLPVVHTGNWPFEQLEACVTRAKLVVPDYQLGHVWSEEQSSSFVGHALGGGPGLPLIINQHDRDGIRKRPELLDGLQRLTAMRRWLADEIPAKVDDQVFFYRETDKRFRLTMSFVVQFVALARIDALRFYKRFNTGGAAHSSAAIEHVVQAKCSYTHRLDGVPIPPAVVI